MSNTEQNRSEQPTSFKIAKAREKGSVARGMDLGFLTSLAAFAGYAWIAGPSASGRIAQAAKDALVSAPQVLASPNEILSLTGIVLSSMVRPLAFMAAVIFVIVLVFEIVQTGPVFSTEPLKLDFNRLNPTQGFKRVFSVRMLIETAKNILKLAVYIALTYVVVRKVQTVTIVSITDARSLAEAMTQTGFRLLILFLAAAAVFAALDQLIVRNQFLRKMRMSRREVRRELRDREGEPRMKQRRKQLHAEFVKMSQSLRNVRGADIVITNPTHYAVALRYDPKTMAAPKVVSRGANQFAQRLKRLAFLYGVVIVQNRQLARSLYLGCELDREIPEAYFKLVADIYLEIRKKKKNQEASSSV
jgi:flagellar biosynthetic protein FlhB